MVKTVNKPARFSAGSGLSIVSLLQGADIMDEKKQFDPPKELARGFIVTSLNDREWKVACRKCSKQWALSKESKGIGNYLFLLNHERSHDK